MSALSSSTAESIEEVTVEPVVLPAANRSFVVLFLRKLPICTTVSSLNVMGSHSQYIKGMQKNPQITNTIPNKLSYNS